jgi:Tfp pilus assembly protein PilO
VTKLPTPAKLGLLVAAVVVSLVAGWLVLISPKRSEAAKVQTEIESVRSEIALAHAAQAPKPRTPAIRVADLFNLSRAMPSSIDIPGVLLQLSHVAKETGVSFQSITPHQPVVLGAYQQIPIDLVFEGRFYDLADFLYRLRNLVAVHGGGLHATGRLFTVDSISFDQGTLSFPQVRATLSVSAYNFGDGTAPPVPAPASASTASASEGSQPIPAAPPGATAAGA